MDRTGVLFKKKTKAKCLFQDGHPSLRDNYLFHCLHYIHYNPVAAKLVARPWEWTFSSAPDCYGGRNGTLCKKELLFSLCGFRKDDQALLVDMDPERVKNLE